MNDLLTFAEFGFRHITDLDALDHILFLLVLAAIYRLTDWRQALWVVTAFTVGHSITLALAVTGVVELPTRIIEFLIPVTIVATGLDNLRPQARGEASPAVRLRPMFAGIFGLIHGAGFANYLRSLFMDDIALPLLGFNIGIELGQIVVLAAAAVALSALDSLIARLPLPTRAPAPFRLRIVAVSAVVTIIAAVWAIERSPW